MATVTYSNNSPYSKTSLSGNYLGLLNPIDIQADDSDISFQITNTYQYRPDLLSFDLYKTTELWWVFKVRNPEIIEDSIFDFVAGTTIKIPKITNIRTALGTK